MDHVFPPSGDLRTVMCERVPFSGDGGSGGAGLLKKRTSWPLSGDPMRMRLA
jgi:hypothetical protein